MGILQNLQKFRVRVWKCYRTHRSSGWTQKMMYPYPGYCGTGRTELIEVSGTGMNVLHNPQTFRVYMKVLQNLQKFRVLWHGRTELTEVPGRYKNAVPVPRVLWHWCTELTEVPGTGMNVVQNLQKFRVRVWICTELTRVPERVISG